MDNNQLIPFERNRYYSGKLLTSTDFQAEQNYMNNKRRFLNSLVFGSGIVCGLSVFNLDDLSIMIESGVAIDKLGREIVVDTSVVKKLSAIEGFDSLGTDHVSLCLRYKEKEVHPVYSVNRQDNEEEYEYNRIHEEYELFLMDTEEIPDTFEVDTEFFSHSTLFENEDYLVEILMPSVSSCGKRVKVLLKIEKKTEGTSSFSADAVLQTPAFEINGGHSLIIHSGSLRLNGGQCVQREYWMKAQESEVDDTSLIAKATDIKILINGDEQPVDNNFYIKTSISAVSPVELVTSEIGKISLEMRAITKTMDYIRLADMKLERTDSAYILEDIKEGGIKKYIPTLAGEGLRKQYGDFFHEAGEQEAGFQGLKKGEVSEVPDKNNYREPVYASGICEIPLKTRNQKGTVHYSGEIMHGLGTGNVYVEVGYEYLMEDERSQSKKQVKQTIYGNSALFTEGGKIPEIETAVKVLNDKGSFVVGAKILKDTNRVILTLRWVAVKLPGVEDEVVIDKTGKSIMVDTPTVVVAPKESHFFHVQFKNMEVGTLTYKVTESGGGEITPDGVYTAPAKEGVYEVEIFCTETPAINTYAYVVVKKKSEEEK